MDNQNNAKNVTPKNIGVCIVLSIITCGIYGLYWICCLNDDMVAISGEEKATSGGMVILLSIITCGIYTYYWMYKQGERVDTAKNARGMNSSNTGIIYLVLTLFGFSIVSAALMQNEINKLA